MGCYGYRNDALKQTVSGNARQINCAHGRSRRMDSPQGCTPPPTFFSIFTNNLPPSNSRPFKYAIDICLASRDRDFRKIEDNRNQDMAAISGYCTKWRLKPRGVKDKVVMENLSHANASQ